MPGLYLQLSGRVEKKTASHLPDIVPFALNGNGWGHLFRWQATPETIRIRSKLQLSLILQAMPSIDLPDSISSRAHSSRADEIIDEANDRIEAFMLADQEVIENFVNCDFHLADQAISWIQENHLVTGNRFCELGSGFGVVTMLAAHQGMESVGIEIESALVDQSSQLADDLGLRSKFYQGSFVPRELAGSLDLGHGYEHVETDVGDVYHEIGLAMDDFDLFFAFPWPGEHGFFEEVFEAQAADGALLLTYRGRDGMNLIRKG